MDKIKIKRIRGIMDTIMIIIETRAKGEIEYLKKELIKEAETLPPKKQGLIKNLFFKRIDRYLEKPSPENLKELQDSKEEVLVFLNLKEDIPFETKEQMLKEMFYIIHDMFTTACKGDKLALRKIAVDKFEPRFNLVFAEYDEFEKPKLFNLFDLARNNIQWILIESMAKNAKKDAVALIAELEEELKKQGII